jgi:hypothetical protein
MLSGPRSLINRLRITWTPMYVGDIEGLTRVLNGNWMNLEINSSLSLAYRPMQDTEASPLFTSTSYGSTRTLGFPNSET